MLDIINRYVTNWSHLQPGLSAEVSAKIFGLCGDLATLPAQWVNSTDVC